MMLAPSGEKLSKRHGAVSVGEYRDMGYPPDGRAQLPRALRLVVRRRGDLLARRSHRRSSILRTSGKADGKFDPKKFADVAFEHLKRPELTPVRRYERMVLPFLGSDGIDDPDEAKLMRAIPIVRERARTLAGGGRRADYFFRAAGVRREGQEEIPHARERRRGSPSSRRCCCRSARGTRRRSRRR